LASTAATRRPVETDTLKLKKAWEIALAPAKQIPMNAIMMYMSGNSLQIFSIMMVFMLFKGPIQGLFNTNAAFIKFENDATRAKLRGVKVIYVLMQLLLLSLGVWKVNSMGLLP
jgi:ER membrane protein complex subunit 4